jgi:hypothetical protein
VTGIEEHLRNLVRGLHPDKLLDLVEDLPPEAVEVLLDEFGALGA